MATDGKILKVDKLRIEKADKNGTNETFHNSWYRHLTSTNHAFKPKAYTPHECKGVLSMKIWINLKRQREKEKGRNGKAIVLTEGKREKKNSELGMKKVKKKSVCDDGTNEMVHNSTHPQ